MKYQLRHGIIALLGMTILILDSKTALAGASEGLKICMESVIPSLYPFIVMSSILTNSFNHNNGLLTKKVSNLFHMPQGSHILAICSIFGGYPIGAQCVGKLYQKHILPKKHAEILLAYCNNAGPAFIFGMVSCFFQEKWIPWTLWLIHIVSAFLVSRWFYLDENPAYNPQRTEQSSSDYISSSIKAMSLICAWVILFRILITFLNRWVLWLFPAYLQIIITGSLELVNGCMELSNIELLPIRFVICSALLALGGVCVAMQTKSVTNGLSLNNYFVGKILQTLFSIMISTTFIFEKWGVLFISIFILYELPRLILKRGSIPKKLRV